MLSLRRLASQVEFSREFIIPNPLANHMRKVLHVGPCDTPGGMATVMHTLAEFPPEGWQAELLASHAPGGMWAKWRAYRRAGRELQRRCTDEHFRPDIVHVHVASDWSWRRKARLVGLARKHGAPVVLHFHSGQFDAWLTKGGEPRNKQVRSVLDDGGVRGVVLSSAWNERLSPALGPLEVVENPLPRHVSNSPDEREEQHLLLLGRDDPVKGHAFAIQLAEALRPSFPDLRLTMTGASQSEQTWVDARGWVSEEEKASLLAKSSVLLIPSAFEGQPLVALEALSAGLPVCASDRIVGLPDIVKMAAFEDVEAWVAAVSDLLYHPPESAALMASAAPYEIDEIQRRWKTIYESY